MKYEDLKVVAHASMGAYSTSKKDEVSIDNWFKSKEYMRENKNASKFMKNLRDKNHM